MKLKAMDSQRTWNEIRKYDILQQLPKLDGGIVPGQAKLQNSWTLGLNQDPKTTEN